MTLTIFLLSFLFCITLQQDLYIQLPGTLYISNMNFKQKIDCTNGKGGQVIGCQFKFRGLPKWLEYEQGYLKMVGNPQSDTIRNIIIMAEDNRGRNTSRIIVLYIDYNYQQKKTVSNIVQEEIELEREKRETTTREGNILINQKETASKQINTTDKIQKQNMDESINLTLIVKNQSMLKQQQRVQKEEFDESRYLGLLNRQAKAHEKVAYYLALLNKEKMGLEEIKYSISILQTRKRQIEVHEEILKKEIEEWKKTLIIVQGELEKEEMGQSKTGQNLKMIREKLESQRSKLSTLIRTRIKVQTQMEQTNQQIKRVSQQLKGVQDRLKQEQEKCRQAKIQISSFNKIIQENRRKKLVTESTVRALQKRSQEYGKQIQDLERRIRLLLQEKRKTDEEEFRKQEEIKKLESRINGDIQKANSLQTLCNQKLQDELNLVISKLEGTISTLEVKIMQYNKELSLLVTQIQQREAIIRTREEEIQKGNKVQNNNEEKIKQKKTTIKQIQTKISRISFEMKRSEKQKLEVNRQIKIQIQKMQTQEKQLLKIHEKLKANLIEKQIVDGLIRKFLLKENHIIDDLGFTKLFQSTNDLPSTNEFNDINNIQKRLQNTQDLHQVNLIPGINLKEEDREQCEGLKSAEYYGSGKIQKMDGNEFEVLSSDGQLHKLKIFSCSLNLSPHVNYTPKLGDLLCWRAFEYDQFDVIIQSLVFRI